MSESVSTVPHWSFGEIWRRSPASWKVAAVVAVGGWPLHVGGYSTTNVNGVETSCSGFDAGPFIVGAVVLIGTLVGLKRVTSTHADRRPPQRATAIIVGVLLAVAAAYLLRGVIDPDGTYC